MTRKKTNIISRLPAGNYTQNLLSKISDIGSLNEKNLKELVQISRKPQMTICMVIDIRGFTKLMEENPGEKVGAFLTGFLDRAGDFILDKKGEINKFLGDGLLAFFEMERANACLDTAFKIHDYFREFKDSFRLPNKTPIGLSTAITSGWSVIGTVGSAHYLDYTILGRHVNKAFRLVKLCKWDQIWITDELKDELADKFLYLPFPKAEIRGMNHVIPIWVFRQKTQIELEEEHVSSCCESCDRFHVCQPIFQQGMDFKNITIDCEKCKIWLPLKGCDHYQHCVINWHTGEKETLLGLESFKLGRECCESCGYFNACFYSFFQAKKFIQSTPGRIKPICCSYCKETNKKIFCKNLSLL